MQRLAGDVLHVRVVQVVADEGKTDIFHMDAYLMGAAGLKGEWDEAVPVFFIYDTVMCDCVFPVIKVYFPLDQGCACAGERSGDRT